MKKIVIFLFVLILLATLTSCTSPPVQGTLNVAVFKGPTGMGAVKLMDTQDPLGDEATINYIVAGAPDEVTAKLLSGELDIAAVPTNLAVTLYNKTDGDIQLLAVNTLGVLYIVGTESENISSMADLENKTISVTGQGSTPEYVLDYLLKANNLEPGNSVTVDFLSEHSELAAKMIAGDITLGMLPEPFVTTVSTQNPEVKVLLNLTEVWEEALPDQELPMGCLVVRKKYLQENADMVKAFLKEYEKSVDYLTSNMEEASALIEEYGILPNAAIALTALPNSNIVYISANESKEMLDIYYQILFDSNPSSIGGAMPDEDFYYSK